MWRGLYLRTQNCAASVILATVLHQLHVMARTWREIQKDFCLTKMQHAAIHAPRCRICLYYHHFYHYFFYYDRFCRSRWPRALRCGSAAAQLLGKLFRNPPAGGMSVSSECCLLSSRCLKVVLISRAEKSYRMQCVSENDLRTSTVRRPRLTGLSSHEK